MGLVSYLSLLRLHRADARHRRARAEPPMGLHRPLQCRRRRLLRDRRLHACDPDRRRPGRATSANLGLPWPVGIVAAMVATALAALDHRPGHDPAARRLPRDRLVRHRDLDSARHAELGRADRRPRKGLPRIARPLVGVFDTPFAFNLWFCFCSSRSSWARLLGPRANPALALGSCAARDPRRRDGRDRAGQERARVFVSRPSCWARR